MYNFAKLTEGSQRFVNTLKASDIVNIAAAKAIANSLALPTFPVDNAEEQYRDTCAQAAKNLASEISEVTVIKFSDVLEYTRQLWLARYYTLNPLEHNFAKVGNPIACFMGFAHVLPPALCDAICADTDKCLVTMVNGFTQIVRELNTTRTASDQSVNSDDIKMLTPRVM